MAFPLLIFSVPTRVLGEWYPLPLSAGPPPLTESSAVLTVVICDGHPCLFGVLPSARWIGVYAEKLTAGAQAAQYLTLELDQRNVCLCFHEREGIAGPQIAG